MLRIYKLLTLLVVAVLVIGACQPVVAPANTEVGSHVAELPEGGAIAQVNDIEMYYEIHGEGEPLLLIHGAVGSTEDFAEVYPAFVEAGFQTIAIDCRGRGRSTDSGQPLSYALMTSDIVALMDQLGIARASLAGQSDGAIIGLQMAIDYPARLDKLIAYGANYNVNGLMPEFAQMVATMPLADFDAMTGESYRRMAPNPGYLPVIFEKIRHMILTQPDFTLEQLMSIQSPVLVFDGENEDVVKVEQARQLAAAIPNSTLVIAPESGHGLMYEDPELYLDKALSFLKGELDAPLVGKYAHVNDIFMYYEIHGEGEPVILIHSVTASSAQFANVIPLLTENYQVITLDFRGHGRTTDSGQPLSYALMASDVVALMDTLGIDAADVVGNKDGGIIGLEMTVAYPERVQRVVAASANYSTDGFQPWFADYVKSVTYDDWVDMTGGIYQQVAPDPTISPTMLEKTRNLLLTQPNFSVEELGTIAVPVLVLVGANEKVLQIEHVEELARAIPNAELVLIEDAGHGVLDEQVEAWIGAVVDFLN